MPKLLKLQITLLIALFPWLAATPFAQDAVPGEILQRTLLIKIGNVSGTTFALDYKGKFYLVTARHVVAELPVDKPTVEVWRSNKWESINLQRILFPLSPDVDIAVLDSGEQAPQSYSINPAEDDAGPTLGQQVWFLGYPFGDVSLVGRFQDQIIPFIKRGTISAINSTDPNAVIVYIDGFNNPGFSGGPILYWDFRKRAYRLLGVVKGYRYDAAKITVHGQPIDADVLVNSGILIGYSIKHAIEAINRKP